MTEPYIPKSGITLDKVTESQIRLGIQGPPNTGKTWAALTWPNTVVVNFNKGLGAHTGRADVVEVPFHNPNIIMEYGKEPTGKVALVKFLQTEAMKMKEEQTLVIDCGTDVERSYHRWYAQNPIVTSSGKVDDFGEYKLKIVYFDDITTLLKQCKCHVVMIWHETSDRDKKGELNGKVKPLLTGQAGDKVAGEFTDWFRAHGTLKPSKEVDAAKLKNDWNMTPDEFKSMLSEFEGPSFFYWQTRSDDVFNAKASSLINSPLFIPANIKYFRKYMRNKTISL